MTAHPGLAMSRTGRAEVIVPDLGTSRHARLPLDPACLYDADLDGLEHEEAIQIHACRQAAGNLRRLLNRSGRSLAQISQALGLDPDERLLLEAGDLHLLDLPRLEALLDRARSPNRA